MIDFIILEQMTAFAVIMQKHPGWVGKHFGIYDIPLIISLLLPLSTYSYAGLVYFRLSVLVIFANF